MFAVHLLMVDFTLEKHSATVTQPISATSAGAVKTISFQRMTSLWALADGYRVLHKAHSLEAIKTALQWQCAERK
jgi:hypothetical protein